MGIELGQQDESFHFGIDEPRFTEWVDLNFYDVSIRLGGFFRLQYHPQQRFTEMTVCLYLPDGRAAFMYERSGVGADSRLGAGGVSIDVIRPFEELNVSFDGKLLLVEDPCALTNPERAYAENPQTDCTVRLNFSSLSTLYEDRGDLFLQRGDAAAGHYEQLGSAIGSVRIGDDGLDVDGFGLRGHRWGIPSFHASSYRRRFTANVGPSFGFMGYGIATMAGARRSGGFVWDGTAFHVCDALTVNTMWTGADSILHGVDLTLKDGDQAWHARGTLVSLVVRRDDGGEDEGESSARRISESMTEWRLDDGHIGYGMSEYFDRIVDGQPMGLAE
jgi:hypothetical protein